MNKKLFNYLFSLFSLFFCLSIFTNAAWKSVGNVTQVVEQKANYIVLQTSSGAKVRVEFFNHNIVRIRLAPKGVFEREFSYAIQPLDRKTPNVQVLQTKDEITLSSFQGAQISIKKSPLLIAVTDENGGLVVNENRLMFEDETGEVSATNLRRNALETYYGFGEKAMPLSRDGQHITNWNTDTYRYNWGSDPLYQSIPFFIALNEGKSYGLFLHNTFRTSFDMGKTAPDKYTFSASGGELDYFIFIGNPKRILADYANLTGKTPLPPIWALGYQQSRFSYFPEAKVREIAGEFRKRKIPADVIYFDIDAQDGFRSFTWDKEKFPNPPQIIGDLAKDGFKSVMIFNPVIKVDENLSSYREARDNNYFVKTADGKDFHGTVWAGKSAFLDFTNPTVRDWFGLLYRQKLNEGIAGFWNDMNEPSNFPDWETNQPPLMNSPAKTIPLDAQHDGDGFALPKNNIRKFYADPISKKQPNPIKLPRKDGTHARFHNIYGMQMARATFEGLSKLAPEKRPFVLSRAGFSGVQRFAAVWTGDNTASWEHLRLSLPMLLNMSVSGIPFVGCDVGGYSDNPSGELFARWLQSAALMPFLRPHAEKGTIDKEPWAFGAEFEKINRESIELRYQLLPYIYTLFRQHERDGMPVMRPLWFEYETDNKTYLIEDQYLIGKDLLVAPVLKEGERKRNVYFPKGDDWRDWQTGAIYKGGTSAEIDTPLEKLPLFARVGAIIPTQPTVQHTGEMSKVDLTLNVIAGISAERVEQTEIFQDAGEGYGYRQNDWRETKIEHKRGLITLGRFGNFGGQKIKFVEVIGIEAKPKEIRVAGKAVETIEFDIVKKRLRFEIAENAKELVLVRQLDAYR